MVCVGKLCESCACSELGRSPVLLSFAFLKLSSRVKLDCESFCRYGGFATSSDIALAGFSVVRIGG